MKLGWTSVEAMLNSLTMSEYVDWVGYFSVDWTKFKATQSPEQMQANLGMVVAASKKKKKKK